MIFLKKIYYSQLTMSNFVSLEVSQKPSPVVIAKAKPEAIRKLPAFSGLLHSVTNDETRSFETSDRKKRYGCCRFCAVGTICW
jgi:hypothetical protein